LLNSKRTILLGILTLILDLHISCPTIEDLEIAGGTYFITDETDFAQHCDYIHYNPVQPSIVPSANRMAIFKCASIDY
jgi:hypothetical protein